MGDVNGGYKADVASEFELALAMRRAKYADATLTQYAKTSLPNQKAGRLPSIKGATNKVA